jgi:hypothetical protein
MIHNRAPHLERLVALGLILFAGSSAVSACGGNTDNRFNETTPGTTPAPQVALVTPTASPEFTPTPAVTATATSTPESHQAKPSKVESKRTTIESPRMLDIGDKITSVPNFAPEAGVKAQEIIMAHDSKNQDLAVIHSPALAEDLANKHIPLKSNEEAAFLLTANAGGDVSKTLIGYDVTTKEITNYFTPDVPFETPGPLILDTQNPDSVVMNIMLSPVHEGDVLGVKIQSNIPADYQAPPALANSSPDGTA